MKQYLFKILKWGIILGGIYFILTTIYSGYSDINYEKGNYNFYWSGISTLWSNEKPFGFKMNSPIETDFSGIDGPYVFGDSLFFVNEKNELITETLKSKRTVIVRTPIETIGKFKVILKDSVINEPFEYQKPEKLVALSDIEGNFTGFYSFLLSNKVIDEKANWIFGNGHLVLNGDFIDRGNKVTEVLWLIYHLENQAVKSGGKVHFILGNHEILNMCGYAKYNERRYIEVAKQISKLSNWDEAVKYRYSQNSEMGKWLRTKNIVEKIGDIVFVHGGLNEFHKEGDYTLKELNATARKYYGIRTSKDSSIPYRDKIVVSGISSPYWDRRLNLDSKHMISLIGDGIFIKKTTQEELDSILDFYDASHIVIGHSIVDDIVSDYNDKVIKIDVSHGDEMRSGKTKGIFIKDNVYKIDDKGNRSKL